MVKARNVTQKRDEDIQNIPNGHAHLRAIYEHEFKCINPSCDADLVLCSIRSSNLVPPYFRTINSTHIQNCPAARDSEGEHFEEEDLTKRRNGMAAFNKILHNLTKVEQKAIANYNWATRKVSVDDRNGNEGIRTTARVKVGPILYDEDLEMREGFTYRIQAEDIRDHYINTDERGGRWINLSEEGILIPEGSILFEEDYVSEFEIIIIPKWIGGQNSERKFIIEFAWIIKQDGELIETYIDGKVETY
ncbi:hypothetical protein C4B25_03085 [Mycoplasma todarodis]|uniref:Uncharacterized protein n=2 Tax=Mycoplasma todarodis TaxID=1937191 RepID=A0A4R0XQX9_9MOLU|nr:hypothetical protein C4B25_03085 [Mycoplasma todarodis]